MNKYLTYVSAERVQLMVQDLVIILADPVLVTIAGQGGFSIRSRPEAFGWVRNKAPLDFRRVAGGLTQA